MMRLVVLVALIGLTFAKVPFDPNAHNERVIGGYDAPPNYWKWQISLQENIYDDGYHYHICGGSLIGASYVVTAAHCISSLDATLYRVVAGEHNIYEYGGTEQIIGVERITVHPDWNQDLAKGYDLALLKLATPAIGSASVEMVNLPYPHQMLPHGFTCYVTGWGLIQSFPSAAPDVLQQAPIQVVEHSVCSTWEWWGSNALKTMICAGGDGVISGCQGDSGGPLNCEIDGVWRLHGVVSYGPAGECNQYSKPTVFTRVSSYLDWIYSVMNN
ncbi:unnamed protein product [Boreogadus saida]